MKCFVDEKSLRAKCNESLGDIRGKFPIEFQKAGKIYVEWDGVKQEVKCIKIK